MHATRQGIKNILKELEGAEFIEDEIMGVIDHWEGMVKEANSCLNIKSIDDLSNLSDAASILERLENAMW